MPISGVQGSADYIKNPRLNYKLDLGEPGLATPSTANESILNVTAHEQQNINRFKAQAAREGGYVIYDAITLNLSYQGSFLAARGGLSTARVIYPDGRQPYFGAGGPAQTPLDTMADDIRREGAAGKGGAAQAAPATDTGGGLAKTGEEEEDEDTGGFATANQPVSGQQLDGLKKAARAELQRLDRFLNRGAFDSGGRNTATAVRNPTIPPPSGGVVAPAPPSAGIPTSPVDGGAPQIFQAPISGSEETSEVPGQNPAESRDETAGQGNKQRASAIRTQIESALQQLEQIDRFQGDQGVQKAQEQILEAVEDMMNLTFGLARAARGGQEGETSAAEEMLKSKDNENAGGVNATAQAQTAVVNKLNTLLNSLGTLMSGQTVDAMA